MQTLIETLNEIQTTQDSEQYYELLRAMPMPCPIIPYTLIGGKSFIIRARVNEVIGEHFSNVSELTYAPAEKCVMSRANLDNQSVFYGSIFEYGKSYYLPINQLTNPNFIQGKNGVYRITYSKWEFIKDTPMAIMPPSSEGISFRDFVNEMNDQWKKISPSLPEVNKELVMYLSKLISKDITDSREFFLLAHFANYMFNFAQKTYDALAYPSVNYSGAGINFAIRPQTIDQNTKPTYISENYYIVKGNRRLLFSPFVTRNIDKDGNFEFEKNKNYTSDKFESETNGLEFFN